MEKRSVTRKSFNANSNILRISILVFTMIIFHSMATANESILKRQEAMQVVRNTMKILGPIAMGSSDYDSFLIKSSLEEMLEAMESYSSYFPTGSETGNRTQASSAIWETRDNFDKLVNNFVDDIKLTLSSDLDEKDLFAKNFDAISKNCRSCHMNYRSR